MSAKTNTFWSRDDVRISLIAMAMALFGMAAFGLIVGAALTIWQRDVRRRFGGWFMNWLLGGLAAAWLLEYPISERLNIPPSWFAVLVVGVTAAIGLRRRHNLHGWNY